MYMKVKFLNDDDERYSINFWKKRSLIDNLDR